MENVRCQSVAAQTGHNHLSPRQGGPGIMAGAGSCCAPRWCRPGRVRMATPIYSMYPQGRATCEHYMNVLIACRSLVLYPPCAHSYLAKATCSRQRHSAIANTKFPEYLKIQCLSKTTAQARLLRPMCRRDTQRTHCQTS